MIKLAGKSAAIEYGIGAFQVQLLLNGELVRQAEFKAWRDAQRVVDAWFASDQP